MRRAEGIIKSRSFDQVNFHLIANIYIHAVAQAAGCHAADYFRKVSREPAHCTHHTGPTINIKQQWQLRAAAEEAASPINSFRAKTVVYIKTNTP